MSAEEKLKGHLHDTLSDLLYEMTPQDVNNTLNQGYRHKRTEAVDHVLDDTLERLQDQVEALITWEMDLDPAVCSACGGSGGGRPPHVCLKCNGSGRP